VKYDGGAAEDYDAKEVIDDDGDEGAEDGEENDDDDDDEDDEQAVVCTS
jgi:hypothetical protein